MMTRRWILVIVAAGCGLPCANAMAATACRAPDPSPLCAAEDPGWEQEFEELVRAIWNMLLHGTDGLSTNVNQAMSQVITAYQENGFRTNLTSTEINTGLSNLNTMESMLQGTIPEGVDTGIAANLLNLIPSMRYTLAPPG